MIKQRGGFAIGLVVGLLVGLALALAVALYITKVPVPFLNKVPQRTAEMDTAEAARNRNWDPNAALGGRTAARAASAAAGGSAAAQPFVPDAPAAASGPAVKPPPSRDPAAILADRATAPAANAASSVARSTAAVAEPFIFFVQAGAFTRSEDAEQQRAKLAIVGQSAKISEREQAGRTVYRVRLGPFSTRAEADALQVKLQEQGIEAQIVRVERA